MRIPLRIRACVADLHQNVTLWPTGSTEDNERTASLVSAKRVGLVSTVMVSVAVACQKAARSPRALVCQTDDACVGFPLRGQPTGDDDRVGNMTCYKGGETVFNNHQMCDVTSTFSLYGLLGERDS